MSPDPVPDAIQEAVMCGECGCATGALNQRMPAGHAPRHDHHDETSLAGGARALLERNARLAERVRAILREAGVVAISLTSAPGSGKTTLLERTLLWLRAAGLRCAVLVGDLATENDALRLRAIGAPARQITTGNVCHLDAHMVLHGLEHLDLSALDVLFLENVGNLVCPADFDLGEDLRVVLVATTEGEDKPAKYPRAFAGADLVLVTKADLVSVLGTDVEALRATVREVAPGTPLVLASARTGLGLPDWIAFVREAARRKRAVAV